MPGAPSSLVRPPDVGDAGEPVDVRRTSTYGAQHDDSLVLPAEEELFSEPTDQAPDEARRVEQGGPSVLLSPDGLLFAVPPTTGPGAADAAAGAVGDGWRGLPPPVSAPGGHTRGRVAHAARFASDALRDELARRAALRLAQVVPGSEEDARVPPVLHIYHSLVPLEGPACDALPSPCLGIRTACFKALSSETGDAVVLRRLDGQQLPPTQQLVALARAVAAAWAPLATHPGVCCVTGAFAGAESESQPPALYVVTPYRPGAATLSAAHLSPAAHPLDEPQLWGVAVQLAAALQDVHLAGCAVGAPGLAPSKLLRTLGGRAAIACGGLVDVLGGGCCAAGSAQLRAAQRADLGALGTSLLALGCGPGCRRPSLSVLGGRVSPRFAALVGALTDPLRGPCDGASLSQALASHALAALCSAQGAQDALLGELEREAEAGRQLRTLMRLSFVLDRPDGVGGDADESGDAYLLRLFRDFLFHCPRDDGAPALDWAGAHEALAKLDAGVPERIILLSRDAASMLVVGYNELKQCVQRAYDTLVQQAVRATAAARTAALAAGAAEGLRY